MFPDREERPVMNFWFYIGIRLKHFAALSAEDCSTILQLQYEFFVLPLLPALKMSFENFSPQCILLFLKTLLRRASVQNFQYHFLLLRTIYAVSSNEHLFYIKYFEQIFNCPVWDTTGKECTRVQRGLALHKVVPISRLFFVNRAWNICPRCTAAYRVIVQSLGCW
jgi:hypothetical protein